MLRLTKKSALAVEAVVDVACYGSGEPVQSHETALRLGLPKRYLEQVMQQLVRAGVLRGVRGPRGGYRLARERRRISVGDVFRTVRGLDEDEPLLGSTSELGLRVMAPFWANLENEFMNRLDAVTIDDLCAQAIEGRVRQSEAVVSNFAI